MKFFKPKFWDKNKISFFSILLFPIALIIKLLSKLQRAIIKKHKCSIPIICIGNIYLGGTGKTPLSIEIFSILKNLNKNPAFIKKKYKFLEDETKLQKKIGSIYADKKRINAIKKAVNNNIDVAILDDGYQDFSIKKDLSIVCFNEKQWIGNGFTIPSGPLREELSSLERASCVVINGKKNSEIENKILQRNKKMNFFYMSYKPQNIEEFKNKRVLAFAGIGNPINFFDLLDDNHINVIKKLSFPDHHNYTTKELQNLGDQAEKNEAILLTTEKDFLRINENFQKKINCLKISVDIDNKDQFIKKIKSII